MLGEKSLDELTCLKRELKAWESMFERKHARKPNKDDVNSAPEEIRETYLKYNQLKRGSKDAKKIDTQQKEKDEIDDDVFGKSLNKSRTPVSAKKFIRIKISPAEYKPIKLCRGQRQKKLMTDKSKTNFIDNNNCQNVKQLYENEGKSSCMAAINNDSSISDDLGFSISSAKKDVLNKPGMMLGKSALAKRLKRRSALASDWLEKKQLQPLESSLNRTDPALDRSNEVNGFTLGFSDELYNRNDEDSENKEFGKSNVLKAEVMFTKKLIVPDNTTGFQTGSTEDCKSVENSCLDKSETSGNISTKQTFKKNSSSVIAYNTGNKNADLLSTRDTTDREHPQESSASKSWSDDTSAVVITRRSAGSENVDDNSKAKRKRSQVVEATLASGRSEPSFGDEEEGKPTKKMKTSDNTYEDISIERNGEDGTGEAGTGEAGEDEQTQSEDSSHRNGPRKKSSGLVSENFRALNMKVRRYSSRGRGTNYAAYKRKMWKQKQQANEKADSKKEHWKKRKSDSGEGTKRIRSTTTTTCFKCGEDGHWAKDCPRNKPTRAQIPAENWSEPMKAPADLEIGDEQWEATEEKLQCLVSNRLPRAPDLPAEAPPAIEPLYQPVNDQPISTPQEVYDALNKLGFDSFRCGQEEAIMQILCGLSTLVVLSTGAGKSLCYQLPAYIYSKRSPCITLVISPLVSLMEDQVVGLPFGLHGVSLNTNMTKQQRQKAVDQICSGKAAVVLVSPEALVGGSSGAGCLPHPSKLPPIAFACIDEAHCVSEWSHNFRPSYLRVCKVLRERFGVRCFLGLTATATRSTALSVCEHLGITHRPEAIVRGATIPDNLNLSVSCDLNRDRAILELLQGSRFSKCDSIIIYCTRRDQTERLATYLRTCLQKNPMNTSSSITDQNEADDMEKENKTKKGGRKGRKSESVKSGNKSKSWQAECYHAGLSGTQRKKVQKKFMAGELRIVVATVAFGMGLDKADVRAVIHYNMPKSFESYVQEIGRAGRDGLPSHCHVFIDTEGKDVRELRRHAYASTVDRNTIKKLVHQIIPTCDCRTLHANMKKKQDKGLVDAGSNADRLNESAIPDLDWFDRDDDVIEKMVELESQSSKELGIPETNRNEMTAKTDTSQNNGVVNKIPQSDEVQKNDVTNNDDVTAGIDVIMSNDFMDNNSNSLTNADVVKNDEVPNEGDIMTTDDHSPRDNDQQTEDNEGCNRICGGHEVAIPIEKAVQQLDMKEEAIETQLCYLELHAKRWVQILKSIRCTCTLKFYGGPAHLHYVAQRVPVVTAAVAYARKRKKFARNTSSLTFPIVEIVDEMGWDLEPVRRELYGLQWNEGLRLAGETGLSAGHSGIIVEFTDLAFHVRAPGDLSGDEKDEVCDFLEDRIMAQERSQVGQLHNVWSTFNAKAHPNCWESAEECDKKVDAELKSVIKAYFESKKDTTQSELEALSSARKNSEFIPSIVPAEEPVNWDAVSRDVRSFITSHGDLELSGRAIARVFHGIDSPCFPASVWGRERGYWRRHLDVDFNLLRKCATKELVKFR